MMAAESTIIATRDVLIKQIEGAGPYLSYPFYNQTGWAGSASVSILILYMYTLNVIAVPSFFFFSEGRASLDLSYSLMTATISSCIDAFDNYSCLEDEWYGSLHENTHSLTTSYVSYPVASTLIRYSNDDSSTSLLKRIIVFNHNIPSLKMAVQLLLGQGPSRAVSSRLSWLNLPLFVTSLSSSCSKTYHQPSLIVVLRVLPPPPAWQGMRRCSQEQGVSSGIRINKKQILGTFTAHTSFIWL